MMKRALFTCAAVTALLASCKNDDKPYEVPKPGTLVCEHKAKVEGDTLNSFNFNVQVVASDYVDKGIYKVKVVFGNDTAADGFTLPRGAENAQVVLRKGKLPNSCEIGFKMQSDTTFYDYYEVDGMKDKIIMKYTKSYSFK